MALSVALVLSILVSRAHADAHKLFKVGVGNASSSHVIGIRRGAWWPEDEDLPVEVRRAIQKSKRFVMVGLGGEPPIGAAVANAGRLVRKVSTLDGMGHAARRAYFDILPTRTALRSEFLHPALLVLVAVESVLDRRRGEDEAFRIPRIIAVDEATARLVGEVIGPGGEGAGLARIWVRARERASGGTIPFTEVLRRAAERARLERNVVPILVHGETVLDLMLESVREPDLEDALLHLARENRGARAPRARRRFVLRALDTIANAGFLEMDNLALARLTHERSVGRLDGLERYRRALNDRRARHAAELGRTLALGGAFVVTDLEDLVATDPSNPPVLRLALERAGLDLFPLEIDCPSRLLSTNVAPHQAHPRSIPWRLKLPSASSNPTP